MDIEQVISTLAFAKRFPVRTVEGCLSNRQESATALLGVVERCADGARASVADEEALVVAIHLLSEMRETRAFQPLMDFLDGDHERVERLLGDTITETLHQILIGVFDGDTDRLYAVMNDAAVDEFVRDSVFEAWSYLVLTGRIDRDTARDYLRTAFDTLRPTRDSYVWVSWVEAVARLGCDDMRGLVEQAFAEGRLMHGATAFRYFERDLEKAAQAGDDVEGWLREERIHPFDDTIGVLSTWHCYSDEYIRRKRADEAAEWASDTVHNPNRLVGRNDPCPCGSGLKYKKCCLH